MRPVMLLTLVSRSLKPLIALATLVALPASLFAADKPAEKATERSQRRRTEVRAGLLQEDFPSQGACISANFPAKNTALKGLAIRLSNGANMLFDTELLRMAAGWTGGFITTPRGAFAGGPGGRPQ